MILVSAERGPNIIHGGNIILKMGGLNIQNIQNIQDISKFIENEKEMGDTMAVNVPINGLLQSINVKLDANPPAFMHQLKQAQVGKRLQQQG